MSALTADEKRVLKNLTHDNNDKEYIKAIVDNFSIAFRCSKEDILEAIHKKAS